MLSGGVCWQVGHVCVNKNGEGVIDLLCYVSDMFVKWPHGQARLMDLLDSLNSMHHMAM